MLEALANPGHERHEEILDWLGGDFDPTAPIDTIAIDMDLIRAPAGPTAPKPKAKWSVPSATCAAISSMAAHFSMMPT